MLVSHRHLDHFHPESVGRYLARSPQATLVSSPQVTAELAAGFRDYATVSSRVRTVAPALGSRVAVPQPGVDVVILGVGHGTGRHAQVQNLGHLIKVDGRAFLHLGDASTEDRTIFERLRLVDDSIDVAFLPVWFLTDSAGQAIVRELIKPRRIVAIHMPTRATQDTILRARRAFPDADFFTTLLERRRY